MISTNALCEIFSQLKRAVPPSRHDDDDNNGSLKRIRALSLPADLVFWPTLGPAILLVSIASQIQAAVSRNSRELGNSLFTRLSFATVGTSVCNTLEDLRRGPARAEPKAQATGAQLSEGKQQS